jgi:hypothetical protein
MMYIQWLEQQITTSEQSLFEVEGLLRRARFAGYIDALKDCKKEYSKTNLDDNR